ncbi:hypothetical protein L1887_61050 [Cichorium endivia]|nr:hypothetical protein L1887_61050 [Cichorium endivia]
MRAISLLSTSYAWLALLFALSVTLPAQHAAAQAPSVKVQLRASWSRFSLPSRGSPFLLELLEAARSQRPSSFFPLIDALTSRHSPAELSGASDEFLANAVEDAIRSLALFGATDSLANQELDAWRMALALQNSAPRVEAFAQLYKTMQLNEIWRTRTYDGPCDSWVHHQGQALCSAQELREAFGVDASQAELRQSHGAAFGHHRATSKPNKGDRPSVILSKSARTQRQSRTSDFLPSQKKQIADLGIKAARLIMSSADPLRAMKELSQNFPTHAAALAGSTKWDDDDASASLVEAVLGLSSMRIQPGSSELWPQRTEYECERLYASCATRHPA